MSYRTSGSVATCSSSTVCPARGRRAYLDADELTIRDVDREEVFGIESARSTGCVVEPVGRSGSGTRGIRPGEGGQGVPPCTNRVAEMCRGAGIAPPEFEETGGAAVVTFRVPVTLAGVRPESRPESDGLESVVLRLLEAGPLPRVELSRQLGQKQVSGQLKVAMKALLAQGRIAYTIPEKPGSRLQKYRLVKPEERG